MALIGAENRIENGHRISEGSSFFILLWLRLVFILQVMISGPCVCVCVASLKEDPAEEKSIRKEKEKKKTGREQNKLTKEHIQEARIRKGRLGKQTYFPHLS